MGRNARYYQINWSPYYIIVRKMMQKKKFQKTRAGYPSYDHANLFTVLIGK